MAGTRKRGRDEVEGERKRESRRRESRRRESRRRESRRREQGVEGNKEKKN